MENLLKGIFISTFFLCLLLFNACSDTPTSNNNTNTKDTKNVTKNTDTNNNTVKSLTVPLGGSPCDRPANVTIANAVYQSAGNYTLTYSWNSVPAATAYEFELLVNGNTAFQNLSVTDTFLIFTQTISATDVINASVKTVCGTEQSPTSKESAEFIYKNGIATDEIIFLANPTSTVSDICGMTCQKLKFTGGSLLNSDGSTITLTNASSKVYYFDFDAIKSCIECSGGTAPLVDPIAFNACLRSPLNQYWIFDPNQYTICR